MSPTADPVARLVEGQAFRMLVGGELDAGDPAEVRPVVDPSTGRTIAEVPEAGADVVERAVEAARRAQPEWAALPLRSRIAHLERFAELLAEHAGDIALLEAIDAGNPLPSAHRDMRIALAHLREWPEMATTLNGRVLPTDGETLSFTSHHPYGVVGRITAFNHPALFAINGAIMPLLAGNTVVVKSSEQAPLSTLRLGELFAEALPPGVVNLVSGGAAAGDAIVTHPRVKRIAFIGGVQTGLKIQERAAQSGTVKHVTLELGGKNAMIVMPDADLDDVVEAAMLGMSLEISQGQSCQATSRILVHRRLYDEFVARAVRRLGAYRIGPAYDEATQIGPLISAEHHRRVSDYVELGEAEGATLLTGGGHPDGAPVGGYYMEPVLFADVRPEMRIAREEVFGPVIAVLPWDDYDEMLELANGIDLGLSGSVWSRDIDLALQTAHRLEAGYIWVNDTNRHYAGAPYGGVKNSGVGREESVEELMSYLEVKVTHVRRGDPRAALRRAAG